MENKHTEKFQQWCLVELFGHQQIAGFVTEATIGGCAFIRVDVPKPDGAGDLYTRYFGNGAIYAINPTTREEVLRIVGALHSPPPTPRIIERAALSEPRADYYADGGSDDDDDDDDSEY